MLCYLINNSSFDSHRLSFPNSITLLVGAVLLSLTTEAVNIDNETSPSTSFKRRSCCAISNFKCNNITSPSEIECNFQTYAISLVPHENAEDNFTLVTDGGVKRLLVYNKNYTEPEFCVGWRIDNGKYYEAALICYNRYSFLEDPYYDEDVQSYIISGVCLLCSVFFAFVTLLIYCLLPWLRDLQGKIIMSLMVAICIGYSTLGSVQLLIDVTDTVCIITGFMIYYWCFATFTWLHISCFNIWRTVVLSRSKFLTFQNPNTLFAIYSAFAWGIPALFLTAALAIEFIATDNFYHIKPQMGESRCWFHSRKAVWTFFYGPLSIIILSNIFYFISVVNRLYKIQKLHLRKKELSTGTVEITKNNEIAKRSIKRLKKINKMMYKNKLYLKLFFAMGITFIFELISELYLSNMPQTLIPRTIFQIMDIVNALQGLTLFIVLILTRRKVLESLCKKFNLPTKYLPFSNDNQNEDEEERGERGDGAEDEGDENEDDDFMTDDDEQNLTSNISSRQNNPATITEAIQMT